MSIKRKTKFLALIALVFFFCVSFFTATAVSVVNAENYNETQSGVVIHQNYDISTANNGKYAQYFIDKNNYTTEYWKTGYSGASLNFNDGYMYEASASGITSTVRLFDEYSGTFSIVGQGFYDEIKTDSGEFKPDYKKLAFQITNLKNPNQYLKFLFIQSVSNFLELNIYYYDKDIQSTSICSYKIAKSRASFTGKVNYFSNKNIPFKFSYNVATGVMDFSNENGVTNHNLTTTTLFTNANANLAFEKYSVDMLFEDKSQQNTAKFTVFELCGKIPSAVITNGYNVATANGGKYADYEISPVGLGEYFLTNYAGNYINFNNGRLYEAGKKGVTSTVSLFDTYKGEFSIVGQGIYDEYSTSTGSFAGDYGKIAFQLTNKANTKQYFKFLFVQSVNNTLELNVYYYDKGEQTSSLYSTKMNVCASLTNKANYYNNVNVPFKFAYDMDNVALSVMPADTTKSTQHDLKELLFKGATPVVFENYSVDMLFENKSQKNTAKFVVYELCEDDFANTKSVTITDMAGATVSQVNAVEGAKYVLPANKTKGFVGYEMGGKIYPAGYVVTVSENITVKQMFITPEMEKGASVRIQVTEQHKGGIRFHVTVDQSAIQAFGDNAKMYGVLIYTDSIDGDFDLNESGSKCQELTNYYEKNGVRGYYITLTNIDESHYQTSYSARAFVEVTLYDGSTVRVATDYVEKDNARSPYQVAQTAKEKGYEGAMIDAYLGVKSEQN